MAKAAAEKKEKKTEAKVKKESTRLSPTRETEELKPKVRIKIKSYDSKIIDNSTKQIIENVERYGAEIVGPVPLPTEIKKYTVNRSTFVHKDSREQYEIRIHQRLIDIINPTQKVIEALTNLNLPAGVDIEIKL